MITSERNDTMETKQVLDCGNMTENFTKVWSQYQYWCEGVLFIAVGCFGIVGNIISISILATREMRKYSFNHLLATLSCFDLAFILCCLPVHTFPIFGLESWFYAKSYQYILYPFTAVFFTGSIYMTLSVTIERYVAVCHPYRHREYNYRFNVVSRILIYTLPVLLLSIILNIPKFYETKVTYSDEEGIKYDVAEVRLTPKYIYWYTISYAFHPTLTLVIVPFLTLVILNGMIYRGIRKARANMQGNNRHSETNLAVTLVSICTVFFVCHALRLYLGLKAVFLLDRTFRCMKEMKYWIPDLNILCLESVSHLLTLICASSNFIIYSTINKKFQIFMRKRYRNRCGVCITSPKVDETIESNKVSKCNDANDLRISCPSGEEVEMASVKGICNLPSICLNNQPNTSFQSSSMTVKHNDSLEGNHSTYHPILRPTANGVVPYRFKDKIQYTQTIFNDKNLWNDKASKDTSSKVSIVSHRSRKIRKLSRKIGKQGQGTEEKRFTKIRKHGSWNSQHKSVNHRKMSRSWSSGSKCQLSLTEEGSVSFIQYSENVEINTMEYLPIYPKKADQVKSKAKRKRNKEMKNSKTQSDY